MHATHDRAAFLLVHDHLMRCLLMLLVMQVLLLLALGQTLLSAGSQVYLG